MKATVLHKTKWNLCVKQGSLFKIIHVDDFETREEFKKIKVKDKIELDELQCWWSMPMSVMKKIVK